MTENDKQRGGMMWQWRRDDGGGVISDSNVNTAHSNHC